MKKLTLLLAAISLTIVGIGCSPNASQLKKTIEENPDIVFEAIKKNPQEFIKVVNEAARDAQMQAREGEMQAEQERMEEEFKNPKTPEIGKNRAIFGADDAKVTIVEYSDFQCPYCARGFQTVEQVLEEYGDKVRVVYKHLPLDFHPMAMPAAKYFEAIALQDEAKAKKFHDLIFQNQGELKGDGEKFLQQTAKKVGADMAKLKKDLDSKEVTSRIESDMAEAKKFGFSGTPGFLINGVSVRGAYPFPEFKKIIDRHLGEKADNSETKEEKTEKAS